MQEIQQLCDHCDIILLQETWLYSHELSYVLSISSSHYGKAISAIDSDNDIVQGRPYGGLAILWRKDMSSICEIVDYKDDHFLGIVIKSGNQSILLLNVYLPFDCANNLDDFMFCLARIDSFITDFQSPYVYACGDFNANLLAKSRFGKEFVNFCENVDLVISDYVLNPQGVFTFYSDAHHSVSWLDHIVTTKTGHDLIQNVYTDNAFITSDHFPLLYKLDIRRIVTDTDEVHCNDRKRFKVKWCDLSANDIHEYTRKTNLSLGSVYINHDLILCDDSNCSNISHHKAIEVMYDSIIDNLVTASEEVKSECKSRDNYVLGWNEVCKEVHAEAREAFLLWVSHSRPKQGPVFNAMKKSRASFKYVLRHCKAVDNKAKADNLAVKFLTKDTKCFWNEIKKINGNDKSVLASTVNGVSGNKNIANMWHDYYKTLLNSTKSTVNKSYVSQQFKKCNIDDFYVSPCDVKEAVKKLKKGKSAGLDSLSSEHYMYASDKIYVLFSIVLNCMTQHGYLPPKFMDTLLIPIVKDKKGIITDGDNYRPIAITSIASKVLELLILESFYHKLVTTNNQFGFKHGLSTELCIFSLRQVIDYYMSMSSPVYICYLDASKAFDRINHWTLCKKLLDRNIPCILVRLLSNWFSSQLFIVQWGPSLSKSFNVCNGVRQGGILSPVLFNVYIDELSIGLTNLKIGCNFNEIYVNHLVYADDTVLIAPSPSALQELVNFCSQFAAENDIMYNLKKTKCMCVRPKWLKDLSFPDIFLDDNPIKVVNKEKYLGAIIVNDNFDDEDIKRQMRSIYAKGNVLIKNFRNCKDDIKLLLFKTFCTGFYCSSLWRKYRKYSYNKTRVAFNNVYRSFMCLSRMDSISAHMINNNVDPFVVVRRKFIVGFIDRVTNCDNRIVKTLYEWAEFRNCPIYKEWIDIAYCIQ